jgi:uncharacterized membrane protein YfcA
MLYVLGILFGVCVGFALGLTGGGGSIFAVPLLVYAMSVPAHEAVGISLAAVGTTAAVGMIQRLRRKEVEVRTGLLFAVTGMCGAPLGAWLNSLIPATWLLILFAVLMLVIALRMWLKATKKPSDAKVVRASTEPIPEDSPGPTCRRDPEGKLRITSQCAGLLSVLGLLTGGLFGVGGGFVIVPALVLFSGMGIHRAVATSLLVITLVSASGLTSYLVANRPIDFGLAGLFAIGGALGMSLGSVFGRRVSGPALQKGFSSAIVVVALFVVTKTFF